MEYMDPMDHTTEGGWKQQSQGYVGLQLPDKHLLANQPDLVVVDKVQKKSMVIDVAIPADANIGKKKQGKRLKSIKGWKNSWNKIMPDPSTRCPFRRTELIWLTEISLTQKTVTRHVELIDEDLASKLNKKAE